MTFARRRFTQIISCFVASHASPPSPISVLPPLTMLSFAGKHGHDENLLHFCMRHKLDGMATLLLQPNNIEGKVYYLQQRGYDNKTPIEIARKNDMKRITEIAQGILVGTYRLFMFVLNYQPYCNVHSSPPTLSLNMKASHQVFIAYNLGRYASLLSDVFQSK